MTITTVSKAHPTHGRARVQSPNPANRGPLLSRLGRWCFTHRKVVLAGWLVALVAVVAISGATGTSFNESLNLPGTDSQVAVTLLETNFPAASGENDQIVIQATHGTTVRSPQVRAA